jgi:hypothetical protein
MTSSVPEILNNHPGRIAVLVGPSIDNALDRAEALAAACDASTILISNRLMALPAEKQRLVVCHELAHLEQLRRGGSDSVADLEAEAWQAAEHAVRGLPFETRLGANRPLFAQALVVLDGQIAKAAMTHYRQFQAERTVAAGAMAVTTVTQVSPVTFDALLDAIITAFPSNTDKSFVLCSHGNKEGLTMPLLLNSAFKANTQTLRFLLQPNATSTRLVAPPHVQAPSAADIASLVGKMQQVQQLGIGSVEFRGCNLGADMANLEAMRDFLNCTTVSGPDVKSSWGIGAPKILTSKQFDDWSKSNGAVISRYPAGRFGVLVNWDTHIAQIAAENNTVIPFWLKDHFFRLPAFATPPIFENWMASFGLHGLHTTPIVFPMDAGYATHIKRVIMTPTGLVRM